MKQKPQQHSHSVAGLVEKRTVIASQIDALHLQIRHLQIDAEALERAILIFEPDYDLSKIRARKVYAKNSFFKHGQLSTTVIDVMREHGGPMNSNEITQAVATSAKIDLGAIDKHAFKAAITTALYRLRRDGVFVEHSRIGKKLIVWAVAD